MSNFSIPLYEYDEGLGVYIV